MSESSGTSPFRGSNLFIGGVVVLVLLSTAIAGLDWLTARNIGTVAATVETIGDTSTARARRPYVVVDLGERGRATAANPSRLTATKGDRVELDDWEGPFFGSHRYTVRAVLPAAPAVPPISIGKKAPTTPSPSGGELMIVGVVLLLVSLGSLAHLWLIREASTLRKLGWTVILLVPLFGPGFYFVLFERLRGQPPHLRARMNEYVRAGVAPTEGPY